VNDISIEFNLRGMSMIKDYSQLTRRSFLKATSLATLGSTFIDAGTLNSQANEGLKLFDGKSLEGWTQFQNSTIEFSGNDFVDFAQFAGKLARKADLVSTSLAERLDGSVQAELAAYLQSRDESTLHRTSMAKGLNNVIRDGAIFSEHLLQGIALRPESQALLASEPRGRTLVQLNRLLLEDAFPFELAKCLSRCWIVESDAMTSTGAGRGVIYTTRDFARFRVTFTMRHVFGDPDHAACVLIFCARPLEDEIPLDALGGIQFQVPNGGHWDYRQGKNSNGGEEFISVNKASFDPSQWSRVEILVDSAKGEARMAVAQPIGARAKEILKFHDATAGRAGPIAWQMHNPGLFDQFKDVVIELNPRINDLITI
jgi:hypothetical protein